MKTQTLMSRQFAEEAATRWWRRDSHYLDKDCTLTELSRLDDQIDALLDGLLTHDTVGKNVALELLTKAGEVDDAVADAFCALTLALLHEDDAYLNTVLKIVSVNVQLSVAIAGAIRWVSSNYSQQLITWCLARTEPHLLIAGLAGAGAPDIGTNGVIPIEQLRALSHHPDDSVRCEAILLGADARATELAADYLDLSRLETHNAGVSYALQRALLLVTPQHTDSGRLWPIAWSNSPFSEDAIQLLGAASPVYAKVPAQCDNASKGIETLTLRFARYLGSIDYVDYAASLLHSPFCKEAQKTLQAVTGYRFDTKSRSAEPDKQFRDWWTANKSSFEPTQRYLYGQQVNDDALRHAVIELPQSQRQCAAIRLCLQNPKTILFDTRAAAAPSAGTTAGSTLKWSCK